MLKPNEVPEFLKVFSIMNINDITFSENAIFWGLKAVAN